VSLGRTRLANRERRWCRVLSKGSAGIAINNSHGGNHGHGNEGTAISTTETSSKGSKISREGCQAPPRIALLTPYGGENLGDAAIQDAMVANVRLRLPDAQFSGICLNCDNFVVRHGTGAFPLSANNIAFYSMSRGRPWERPKEGEGRRPSKKVHEKIRRALKSFPILWRCLKVVAAIAVEVRHSFKGYLFLRTQNIVIVSGGGQLNEQYGGAWGQPFALFKWAVLARIARVPYAVASVGVGELKSRASRLFVSVALRLACYRSYRDKETRDFAASLMQRAARDPIVPDLAFSLTSSELPPIASTPGIAGERTVIAISPIAFAKPGIWPIENRATYNRYVEQLAQVMAELLRRDYFLVMVWSSLGDDESVIPDLFGRLDQESRQSRTLQIHIPTIGTWRDFVSTLGGVDFLIASRLHSAILGFVSETPTIAISFERKVTSVMADLGQTDYLLEICDFTSKDVIEVLDRLELRGDIVSQQIASYRHRIRPVSDLQYDTLAELVMASHRNPQGSSVS
jgi:polysaccharide pyruvyl transferase WcaK-like protein